MGPHHLQTEIGGRDYLLEMVQVSDGRWRAQIVRRPGVPTALMPFYGETPDEAAARLTSWLTRAHANAGASI